jgi:hypothetical protein
MAARDWNIENIVNTLLIISLVRINVPAYITMIQRHLENDVPPITAEVCRPFEDYKGGFFIPGGFIHPETILTRGSRKYFTADNFEPQLTQVVMEDNATLLYPNRFEYNCNLNNGVYSEIALRMLNLAKSLAAVRQTPMTKQKKYTTSDVCKSYNLKPAKRKGFGAKEVITSCLAAALTKHRAYKDLCGIGIPLSKIQTEKFGDIVSATYHKSPSTGKTHFYNPFVLWCHTSRILEESLSGLIQITGPKFGQFATITLEYVGNDTSIASNKIFASVKGHNYAIMLRKYPQSKPGERPESKRARPLKYRRFGLTKVTDKNILSYSV